MKRYFVFLGSRYHPGGGMQDFIFDCDSYRAAIMLLHKHLRDVNNNAYDLLDDDDSWCDFWEYHYTQIYDTIYKKVVFSK
jgi:hypothetical protein